jgi:dipeptide/tripeptide permease
MWFAAAGLGIACVETARHSVVAANAPTAVRSSGFGLLAGIQSLGNFVASALAGVLWTVFSAEVAFVFAAACMLLALMVFARPSKSITTGLSNAG